MSVRVFPDEINMWTKWVLPMCVRACLWGCFRMRLTYEQTKWWPSLCVWTSSNPLMAWIEQKAEEGNVWALWLTAWAESYALVLFLRPGFPGPPACRQHIGRSWDFSVFITVWASFLYNTHLHEDVEVDKNVASQGELDINVLLKWH